MVDDSGSKARRSNRSLTTGQHGACGIYPALGGGRVVAYRVTCSGARRPEGAGRTRRRVDDFGGIRLQPVSRSGGDSNSRFQPTLISALSSGIGYNGAMGHRAPQPLAEFKAVWSWVTAPLVATVTLVALVAAWLLHTDPLVAVGILAGAATVSVSMRYRVLVWTSGIQIRRPLSSEFLSWGEIVDIEVDDHSRTPSAIAVTADRRVPLHAVHVYGVDHKVRWLQRVHRHQLTHNRQKLRRSAHRFN